VSQALAKQFYRIGEVSRIVGVQPHVLRYWETEFRTIRPEKSSRGQRVYSRRDVEKFLTVKDLLKNQGFSIAGARRQLHSSSALVTETSRAVLEHTEPPGPNSSGGPRGETKALRRALVRLREDLLELLDEFSADGRPDSPRR
jgi:DNA-binding transcriptional MerR regulator